MTCRRYIWQELTREQLPLSRATLAPAVSSSAAVVITVFERFGGLVLSCNVFMRAYGPARGGICEDNNSQAR